MTREILVLQPHGKTGRRVVPLLRAHEDVTVRGASRGSTPPFDWEAPDTWPAALAGADAAFIVYFPDIAFPGAADRIGSFIELAVRSGVGRLVLLSGRGEHEAEKTEEILAGSGADWTIVRSAWFTQNFSEGFLVDAIHSGVIAMPGGDVREPFVDVDDIAEVVVAALTDDRHIGRLYEVTGPRLLSFADTAKEIGQALGRDIVHVPVTMEQYHAGAVEHGVPADYADLLIGLFTETLDGRNARLTDGVLQALGREPRDFADHVKAMALTGVWDPA